MTKIHNLSFRPLNKTELNQRSYAVLDTPGVREVEVKEKATSSVTKKFTFDRVFGHKSQQEDVYKAVVGPLINQVMQGKISIYIHITLHAIWC